MTQRDPEPRRKPLTFEQILCFLTTAGLIVLAFAFAFHVDKQATQDAFKATSDLAKGHAP